MESPKRRQTDKHGWARPQYVIPFAILAMGWGFDNYRQVAKLEAQAEQRPDLIERRNREIDALQACMQRQIDLVRSCRE